MSDLFTEVYNWLPLCHLINQKVLVRQFDFQVAWEQALTKALQDTLVSGHAISVREAWH